MAGTRQLSNQELEFLYKCYTEGFSYAQMTKAYNQVYPNPISERYCSIFCRKAVAEGKLEKRKFTRLRQQFKEEEYAFIYASYEDGLTYKNIASAFSIKFNKEINLVSLTYILAKAKSDKLIRPNNMQYSKEEKEFVINEHNKGTCVKEIAMLFSDKFRKINITRVKGLIQREHLKQQQNTKPRVHVYTDELLAWCKEMRKTMTLPQLCNALKDTWGINRCPKALSNVLCRHNIYKEGEVHGEACIGYEGIRKGITYVKVLPSSSGYYSRDSWVPKARVIYESVYGKLPDDMTVVHLNGNKQDFRIENLYAVHYKSLGYMANSGSGRCYWSEDPEITKTALMAAELQVAIKEVTK